MSRPKTQALICSIEGCGKPTKSKGFCRNHYAQFWRTGNPHKINTGDKRNHPFYSLWFERKQANQLCEAWLDFKIFIQGISPKPGGDYFLLRKREGLFGPDNFEWREHLKRKEGEPNKDWWARKWAARQSANPGMERARSLKRYYGLTVEQFNQLLVDQNFVCEICKLPETAIDGKSGTIKRLSVDHNHDTGKARGLLCGRCNTTLGKINENINLLQDMINYLNKYEGTKNG